MTSAACWSPCVSCMPVEVNPCGRTARARKPCPYESFSINGHGDLRTSPLRTDDLLGFRQHETPSESTWTTRQHVHPPLRSVQNGNERTRTGDHLSQRAEID